MSTAADLADVLLDLLTGHDSLDIFERPHLFQAAYSDATSSTISIEIFPANPLPGDSPENEEFTLTVRKTRKTPTT